MNTLPKILVIDDHPSFIEGISLLLQSIIPNATIINALNGAEALALANKKPDIDWIFLDINLPDTSGISLIEHFENKKILANIVVMTSENNPDLIDQVLKRHVSGYLTKDFNRKILHECISVIEDGGVFLLPEHTRQLKNFRESLLKEKQLIEQSISDRQKQTLLMLVKGYSNKEIAQNLCISESTVKTHVSSLISLFEADNRTHCVAEARRLQILD